MEILILRNYTFLGVNCLVFSEKKLREIESLTLETNFTRLIQKKYFRNLRIFNNKM